VRIRRNIIAPLILTIGTVGSLVAVPVASALSTVAPATTAVVAATITSDASIQHG